MKLKYCVLILITICFSQIAAQTTISINTSPFLNSKIQLEQLNNPDLQGSLMYAMKSTNGQMFSLNVISYLKNKLGLKLGLGLGTFKKSVIFYASPAFINFGEISTVDTYNIFQAETRFGELSIGANLPLMFNKKKRLNFSINSKLSYVLGNPITMQKEKTIVYRTATYYDEYDTPYHKPFIDGEMIVANENKMQLGFDAEIMYEYNLEKIPLGFHFGIVGSHTPKPYFSGWINLIGHVDTLETTISGNISYVAMKVGITYTFGSRINSEIKMLDI